jgi:Phosphoribulokinase / Uridine kinase family
VHALRVSYRCCWRLSHLGRNSCLSTFNFCALAYRGHASREPTQLVSHASTGSPSTLNCDKKRPMAMASKSEEVSKLSGLESHVTVQKRAYYAPPWADVSIIGVAGSSGSGKSTISQAIVKKLNLPWVVILSLASHHVSVSYRLACSDRC